jgi:hypothetical protein
MGLFIPDWKSENWTKAFLTAKCAKSAQRVRKVCKIAISGYQYLALRPLRKTLRTLR